MGEAIHDIPLRQAARQKYLNYALSVITARALPDIRDGLKPVQRRILFAMWKDLRLLPDRKELKCAKVVGEVLGNYHPHGDSAVYDALVRMAQDWMLRAPLVAGHGNFGSLDGDRAAAYRYTEAKLRPFAGVLLEEIDQETVDFRNTFDGVRQEPVVLPAKAPILLINGATGIAVGIATNIPPHNLGEVVQAAVALIDDPEISTARLSQKIKAPDFPTGGQILNTRPELKKIYETGSGAVKLRATYKLEKEGRSRRIVIDSVPYMVKKQDLVGKIRDLALDKKVPQIVDVRDESTDDVRVVLDLKSDANPKKVMAYLFKTTDLQHNFNVNLTCLVPQEGTDVAAPRKLDLKEMLRYFLDFRYAVVVRRFEYELRKLRERIHILDGFAKVFRALDDAIAIIRKSKDKKDAAAKLRKRFNLDDIQVNAILEMMLYRLAALEIQKILDERREKKKRAREIEVILGSAARLWKVIRSELTAIAKEFGDKRRSLIKPPSETDMIEVSAEDLIAHEDQYVILTDGGWVKRVGKISSIDKISVKQGDRVLAVVAGSTKESVVFFSNYGAAYTTRIMNLPASRGHGEPIQKHFRMKDGERIVSVLSLDPRAIGDIRVDPKHPDLCPPVHALAVTTNGFGLRFGLGGYVEPSTKVGRKFARLAKEAEVLTVLAIDGSELVVCISEWAHALICRAEEINYLEGPGKGVYVMKVAFGDRVLGVRATAKEHEGLKATTTSGGSHNINARRYRVTSRGGKGHQVVRRGKIEQVESPPLEIPVLKGKRKGG